MFENNPFEFFSNVARSHNEKEEAYSKLRAEEPKLLKVGDKVLLALGLLGYGFVWIREEGDILDIRDSSVKVKFQPRHMSNPEERWIDRVLVTDIIERANVTPEKI